MNERRRDLFNTDATIDKDPQAAADRQQQQSSASSSSSSSCSSTSSSTHNATTTASPLALTHTPATGLIPNISGARSTSVNAPANSTNNYIALRESSVELAGGRHLSSQRELLGFSTQPPQAAATISNSIEITRKVQAEGSATAGGDDGADRQTQTTKYSANSDSNGTNNAANGDSERRYRPQKFCAVCGDKAIACNFNAVTCESCKAFFRRNAFKEQRLKCLFDNRCIIDRATRRFCSKCRLLKCFQIGMKREWILTDEQKQIKRVKILQNKQSRKQVPVGTTSSPTALPGSDDSSPRTQLMSERHHPPTHLLATGEQFRQEGAPREASVGGIPSVGGACDEGALTSAAGGGNSNSRSQTSGEAGGRTTKRPRTSQKVEQQQQQNASTVGNTRVVEYRDASTSCPDDFDLLDPNLWGLHYCTFASQCQYCSLRLDGHCTRSASERIQQQLQLQQPQQLQQPFSDRCAQINHHHHHLHHHHQQQQQQSHEHQQRHHQPQQQEHYHQQLQQHLHQQQQQHHQHDQCEQIFNRLPTYMSPAISTRIAASTNGLSHHHHRSHLVANATPGLSPGPYGSPTAAAAITSAAAASQQQLVSRSQADRCCLETAQAYSQTPTAATTTVASHFASRVVPSQIIQFPASVGQQIPQLHVMTPSSHLINSTANLPAADCMFSSQLIGAGHNGQPVIAVTCPSQIVLDQSGGLCVASSTSTSVRASPTTSSQLTGWHQAKVGDYGSCSLSSPGHQAMATAAASSASITVAAPTNSAEKEENQQNDDNENGEDDENEDDDENEEEDKKEEEYDFDLYNYHIDDKGNKDHEDSAGGQGGNKGIKKKKKFLGLPPFVYWDNIAYAVPAQEECELFKRLKVLRFTDNESELIGELIEGTRFLFEQSTEREFQVELNDIVAFCDVALRRLIKTVKQIRTFRLLNMDDQIMLLKAACFKILLLRSSFHYNDQVGGWNDTRTGRVMHLDILKQAKRSLVYEKHFEMLKRIPEPLRKDRFIMSILALALLFDPSSDLKHSNSVELDNLIYLSLLRKYLLQTQPDPLSKYQCLIIALQLINECNDAYNVFFAKDLEPEHIPPLLMEIFDISINNKTEE